jgi:transposase
MKPHVPEAFAACVGLDWAAATQAGGLQAAGAAKRACFPLEHTPEAIDAWGTTLRTRLHGPPVALCLERTTGPLVFALRTYDFLVLFPLHPLTLARSRAALPPRRAKAAPSAAALQLALRLTPRGTLQPLQPHSSPMRALAQLVAHRRRVLGDTVRLPNRLPRTLKNSCPHVLQ